MSLTRRAAALTDRIVPLSLRCEQAAVRGMSDAEVAILKRPLVPIHENPGVLMHDKPAD